MAGVSGLSTIQARLDASVVQMHAASREVAIQVSEAVVADAAALAPVSEPRDDRVPGALRDSIKILSTEETPHGFRCKVGTHLFYAGFIEFGTRNARPIPFMRPAKHKGEVLLQSRSRSIMRARVTYLRSGAT